MPVAFASYMIYFYPMFIIQYYLFYACINKLSVSICRPNLFKLYSLNDIVKVRVIFYF